MGRAKSVKAKSGAGSVNNGYRARTGRPPMVIAPDVLDDILLRIIGGESMRSICRDPDMPSRDTIHKRIVEDSDFGERFARARELQYAGWADEILEISDDGTTDYITKTGRNGHEYQAVDQEHIQRSRLRVDARKWLLSKLMPNQYGDKVMSEVSGAVTHKVDITGLSEREKMRRFALFMLEDKAATVSGKAQEVAKPSPPASLPVDGDAVTKLQASDDAT